MTGSAVFSRIIGTGSYLPESVVTNDELAARLAKQGVETSDDWIVSRTGIRQRHIADDSMHTSDLAARAAQAALVAAGKTAADVDLIIVATSTPDYVFPSTACLVQAKIGNHGAAAFDVQAVCSGFAERGGALSLAAFQTLEKPSEQLSAFFVWVMTAGSELFGPFLTVSKTDYQKAIPL